ncbi:hypothetical protein Mapa_012302 [Marchantia paleacea]|nr:hypothetical protein Mapa_012302 [Marchantia paleacea]
MYTLPLGCTTRTTFDKQQDKNATFPIEVLKNFKRPWHLLLEITCISATFLKGTLLNRSWRMFYISPVTVLRTIRNGSLQLTMLL